MRQGLARYGLPDTLRPFGLSIDPVARPHEIKLFQGGNGYISLQEIDNAIREAIKQKQPSMFLVAGPNGTGRTSVANCILARYVAALKITPQNLIAPRQDVTNHDKLAGFKKWMTTLRTQIVLQKRITLPEDLAREFTVPTLNGTDRDTMGPVYQGLMLRLTDLVGTGENPYAIACCLEDVPTFDYISAAFESFADVPTICIFTAKDYEPHRTEVIKPFTDKVINFPNALIQLKPVLGKEAYSLLDARWQLQTAVPNPFDPTGIEKVFADSPRPIARILTIIERMLAYKVKRYNLGPVYPGPQDKELSFPEDEIVGLMAAVDN